jgi:hypothetical protein
MFTEGINKIMTETKTLLISKKNNPKEFFSELHRIRRDEYQQKEKVLSELIIKINKEDGVDFCQIAVDAINDGFRCFDVTPVLEESLADMNLNISSVLMLAESLFEGMQGDMAAFRQFKSFEDLVVKQPEFTRNLLEELLKQDKPYVVGYVSTLYQSLSKNNEREIHKELCTLKTHKSKYVLMAVADALGALNYKPSKNQSLVKKTFNVLEELEAKNLDEVKRIAVFAYMKLFDYSEQSKNKLIKLSESNQPLILGALSHVLLCTQEKSGNEQWFSDVLLNLTNTSCDDKGIIENIDFVLAGLIEKNDNWDLAEGFFISWLQNSNYNSKNDKLSDLFNSTIAAIVNRREKFEILLTKFFNHDSFKIHGAASELISYCQLHKVSQLNLDKKLLKSMSYEDCLYICRKVLGYVISSEYLCSLCFSILDKSPRNKKLKGLIYSVFRSHIGENYPGRTIEFLKKVSSQTKSINKKQVADQVVEDIENYFSERESLPKLNELIAPKQRSQKIFIESNKKMKAAMEEAQQNSIVSMIASRIVLKHGKGSFHFMDGKYSNISKLGLYSKNMEMPHAEITHPVDAALERMNFRLVERGQ